MLRFGYIKIPKKTVHIEWRPGSPKAQFFLQFHMLPVTRWTRDPGRRGSPVLRPRTPSCKQLDTNGVTKLSGTNNLVKSQPFGVSRNI